MKLTQEQIDRFSEDGILILEGLFSQSEVNVLKAELPALFAQHCPENWREKDSDTVRLSLGLHLRNEVYAKLVRHPRLLEPASQILGEPVYLQQVKVNAKPAHNGEIWQWHYDFAHHHREDGNPRPLALNVHVLLDECSQFNGPLWFIPGSHKLGEHKTGLDASTTSYELWTVPPESIEELVAARGIIPGHGSPGTVLIFGELMVHGSPNNMSPWPRSIFSVIYNPISNQQTTFKRPDFQHHRDFTPVTLLPDDCLLLAAA